MEMPKNFEWKNLKKEVDIQTHVMIDDNVPHASKEVQRRNEWIAYEYDKTLGKLISAQEALEEFLQKQSAQTIESGAINYNDTAEPDVLDPELVRLHRELAIAEENFEILSKTFQQVYPENPRLN